jgi:hypothetical protein
LAAQKQLAMMKIETAISCVEALRTEDNASEVALMVEALLMALKDFQTLDPQHAPEREIFDRLANQLREVSVKFASAMSVA